MATSLGLSLLAAGCQRVEKKPPPPPSYHLLSAELFPGVSIAEFSLRPSGPGNENAPALITFRDEKELGALHNALCRSGLTFDEIRVMGALTYFNVRIRFTDGLEMNECGSLNLFSDRMYFSLVFSEDEGFTAGPFVFARLDSALAPETVQALRSLCPGDPAALKPWRPLPPAGSAPGESNHQSTAAPAFDSSTRSVP